MTPSSSSMLRRCSLGLAVALSLTLAACGGTSKSASSSSSSSTATSSAAPAPATTIPTAAQVVATCNAADNALQPIANAIEAGGATMDYATLDDLVQAAVAPAQNCQNAMQASIPGLPANAQGPAGQYAAAIGQVVALLKAPPTDGVSGATWASQIESIVSGPGKAAKAALAAADPTFNN